MEHTEYIIVTTTTDSRAVAERLAGEVLGHRLGACIQILPITSHYRWQGKLEVAAEFRCDIKTHRRMLGKLRTLLEEHHNYDVPQIVVVALEQVAPAYAAWLEEQLDDTDR